MNYYKDIEIKLSEFINKYYRNELLKGLLLFLTTGLLYFLFTIFIEHLLWLNTLSRTVLFCSFITVELLLFSFYILLPTAKLFGLKKGISKTQASTLIGSHFPEISDKLLNVLQLGSNHKDSELVLASIAQKSKEFKPIPFKKAVDFKKNIKFFKYLGVPVLIFLITLFTGNSNVLKDSYTRVVNFQKAYTPPAPFNFFILNDDLNTQEGKRKKIEVRTVGSVLPDNVSINYLDETYLLNNIGSGLFEYTFINPKKTIDFYFSANDVQSKPYALTVQAVPSITDFKMVVEFPKYLDKKNKAYINTGNAVVPEGSKLLWNLTAKTTDTIHLLNKKDTIAFTSKDKIAFLHSKTVLTNFNYTILTSNSNVKDYENLSYNIEVIKDQFPKIEVKTKRDTITGLFTYHLGNISDDYGIKKLQVVYYTEEDSKKSKKITVGSGTFNQFTYAFPSGLDLKEGKAYSYYFEVFDNDPLNGYKSTKSEVFQFNSLTETEQERKQLKNQSESIQGLSNSLQKLVKQEEELAALRQTKKEKKSLNWNDKKKLQNFLNRQEKQDQLMKSFNKKLQDNLNNFQKENVDDDFKQKLQDRLANQLNKIEEDEKLLEEIRELQEKIREEDLAKKIENLQQKNEEQQRSLEQLLELTKKYYVEKKAEKIANDLKKLAAKQEQLANSTNVKEKKQELLNKAFEEIKNDLEELDKENKELKNPVALNNDKKAEETVAEEQEKALDNIKKNKQQKASKNQKNAAEKMLEMSKSMQQMMQMQSGEQLQEDTKMLRQILDNLIFYSFDQEEVMKEIQAIDKDNVTYSKKLKKQQKLRTHFKHVDDSLFALSLRNPMISDKINKEVTDVHFNIDKSLELLAETDIYKGTASQQYAITAANNLADYLSEVLNNMQNQMMNMMPGSGQCDKPGGSGKGFQLSDIIQQQQQNIDQMKEGMSGKNGKESQGKEGKGKNGENGNQKGGSTPGGYGGDEIMSGELFKIYQQQQALKQQLKDALSNQGTNGNTGDLLKEVEAIEEELLDKGFTNEIIEKMVNLKHELLKLENARLKQGQDAKREANTNIKQYQNSNNNVVPSTKDYFNEVEILDRQALPLQTIYKKKVNRYFKDKDAKL